MAPPFNSEEWNASCALRPATLRRDADVHWAYFGMSWFMIILMTTSFTIGAIVFYFMRKRSIYLQKRNFPSIVLMVFGVMFMITPGPIRDVVGRENFSCELAIWTRIACMVLVPLPIMVNLFFFRNQLIWAKTLSRVTFTKLQEIIQEANAEANPSLLKRASIAASFRPQSLKVSNSNFSSARDTGDGEMSSGKSDTRIGSNASSFNEAEFVSAMKKRSYVYQASMIFAPAIPSLILGFVFQFSLPYYGHGCIGCYDPFYFTLSISLSIGLLVVVVLYYAYALRKAADPFDILYDLKMLFIWGPGLGGVGLIGYVIDEFIGSIYDRGIFSWDWLVLGGAEVAFFFLCIKPIYVAWRLEQKAKTGDKGKAKIDFKSLLDNVQFQSIFREHLVGEWSIENLNFYNQATRFKTHYGDFKTIQQANVVALQTYNTFVRAGSLQEINLPAQVRDRLSQIFDMLTIAELQSRSSTLKIAQEVFDDARTEICLLMEKDSFSRFQNSKDYDNFATNNLIVDPQRNVMVVSTQL